MNCVRYIEHSFQAAQEISDGFTNHKDGCRPGQPKTINVNIAAVSGLTKRDARLTLKTIAHSVGISSGSAHNILTQQ